MKKSLGIIFIIFALIIIFLLSFIAIQLYQQPLIGSVIEGSGEENKIEKSSDEMDGKNLESEEKSFPNAKIKREAPDEVLPSQEFQITYRASGLSSKKWGASIVDSVSGGCEFPQEETELKTVLLSVDGDTKTIAVKAPESGSCTFSGDYKFGNDPIELMSDDVVVVGDVVGMSGEQVNDINGYEEITTDAKLTRVIEGNIIKYVATPSDEKYGYVIEDTAIGSCHFSNGEKLKKVTIISPTRETSAELVLNGDCKLKGVYVYANSEGGEEKILEEIEI